MLADNILLQEGVIPRLLGGLWVTVEIGFLSVALSIPLGVFASIAVFTFWGAAEMGDLVRGALTSIPSSQYDSAFVLGLSRRQTFLRVVLPQAIRRLLPPAINLITRMIKTTALCNLIGVVEVIRVGSQITDFYRFRFPTTGALWIYGAIFFLYFVACFPLSLLARRLERSTQK